MLCALIQNNVVVATVDLSSDQIALVGNIFPAVIDISAMSPQPQIGWAFDGQNINCPSMRLTKLAFRLRFTTSEMTAIYSAAVSNFTLQYMLQNNLVATYIDLSLTTTQSSVMYLVSLGLITSGRATTILTTPPGLGEIFVPGVG